MALTISLPIDAESRLRERARAAGQEVTQYIEQLITSVPSANHIFNLGFRSGMIPRSQEHRLTRGF